MMKTSLAKAVAVLWLLVSGLAATMPPAAHAACTSGACVSAGPRLASVDSKRSVLLNALLGNLLGTNLNVTVADWNTVAQGGINLAGFLNALQANLGVSSPSAALSANATLAQIVSAMAVAAQADGNTALVSALNNVQAQVAALPGSIRLGDLLAVSLPAGALANVKLNALDLLSGSVQLYNYRNVLTTPTPVTISGSAIGLGGVVNSIQLSAQVIEPPVYRCGPAGAQFHTAAVRVKLNVNLVTLSPDASALNLIAGVSGAAVALSQLELYTELARAEGVLAAIDALGNAVTVQATPGVADLYLGTMSDAVFFNRGGVLNPATDLGLSTIGTLTLNGTTVNIQAKSYARGQAPFMSTLVFNGPYPQTRTASTSAAFAANLVDALVTNMELSLSPSLGLLDASILPTLKGIVSGAITPVLNSLLTGFVNPLLELLGIRLGEVDVTVYGIAQLCSVSGVVYHDPNHNSRFDSGETGTGLTLYAKLIPASAPGGPALQAATVDPASGAYAFPDVLAAAYVLVIDTNGNLNDVTPGVPAGWLGTEAPGQTRTLSVTSADIVSQNFGLYNGSRLTGTVFKDNGSGGGAPNNGVQDGAETGLAGVAVKVTDAGGTLAYDIATTNGSGAYVLWIPAAAGANSLRVTESNPGGYISVGGAAGDTGVSYSRADDTVTFTNVVGTGFSGVNFADVADNSFSTDGQQAAVPGSAVFYPHAFVAGTGGQVSFTAAGSASPAQSGWSSVVYLDSNCNGVPDAGENPVTGALIVSADQKVCLLVKTFIPQNAPYNAQYQGTLTATFSYVNTAPALTATYSRTDLTVVGKSTDAGLRLVKAVDKMTAKPGDTITYTITYTNNSASALTNIRINDATPAYTTFNSAACGALPEGITACTVAVQPTADTGGSIEWRFNGMLGPGASGSVTFGVTLR